MPEALKHIFILAFGASVGSFLNVCIYRIPIGKSILSPASSCPSCGLKIRFYDNIPVLSYILLRARCRHCREPISFQYPLVEILTSVSGVFLFRRFGLSAWLFVYALFISSLIVVTFIDLSHRIIPDVITLPGIVMGTVFSALMTYPFFYPGVVSSLAGIAAGGGIVFVISSLYYLASGQAGMGGGDVKLLAMVGAFLGWKGVFFTLFSGAFVGAAIGLSLMVFWGKKSKYALPFGPFLSLGAYVYVFYGRELIDWYISGVWPL